MHFGLHAPAIRIPVLRPAKVVMLEARRQARRELRRI
jgi:hypothetical protein